MKRIFHKSKNFKDAEDWDIIQHTQMTPEERQEVAAELRRRVYGEESPDVREVRPSK
jgi:hypothetical protein